MSKTQERIKANLTPSQRKAWEALARRGRQAQQLRQQIAQEAEPVNVAIRVGMSGGVGFGLGWADATMPSFSLGDMEFDPSDGVAMASSAAAISTGDKMAETVASSAVSVSTYKRSLAYWTDRLPDDEEAAA
jgi:hypothetical protein